MKTAQDKRLWLDRFTDQRPQYGIFEDQRFYSKPYEGEKADDVRAFMAKVDIFRAWLTEAYGAVDGTQPEFPEELCEAKPVKRKSSAKATSVKLEDDSTSEGS